MLHNIRSCYITVYLKHGSFSRYIVVNFYFINKISHLSRKSMYSALSYSYISSTYVFYCNILLWILRNFRVFLNIVNWMQKSMIFKRAWGNFISYILIFWSQLKVDTLMDSLVDNTSSIFFSLLIGFQIYSKMNINIDFAIFSMESITQHMPIKLKTIPRYLQCLNLLLRIMR